MTKGKDIFVLGIEGGGTKTTWALVDQHENIIREGKTSSGNTQQLNDSQLLALFRSIHSGGGRQVDAIGGAFAGCHLESERQRVKKALQRFWPNVSTIEVGEDTQSALAGAHGKKDGICVIAGTGSNVFGRKNGHWEKAGGWGHLFADVGSGYDIARRGLQEVYAHYDATQKTGKLAERYLAATRQNNLEEMDPWVLAHGSKTELASLSHCVFEAAEAGDRLAKQVIQQGIDGLVLRVQYIAKRLKIKTPSIGLVGGLFEKIPLYEKLFRQAVHQWSPRSSVFVSRTPGAIGASRMVLLNTPSYAPSTGSKPKSISVQLRPELSSASTEQLNPRSKELHRQNIATLVDLFIQEQSSVQKALRKEHASIVKACQLAAATIKRGGRIFYVGAGTSGRLGVLDASEIPPTFGVSPELFQAIIAGGAEAVWRSQEGAEDNAEAGQAALIQRGVKRGDLVCGIAASGRTPFVLGALAWARKNKIKTVFLTCNPHHPPVAASVSIDLSTGPEIIAGSTRLKAGSATKEVLNMISSIAMIRQGRVRDGWMIGVKATNEKLKERAIRLVMTLARCTADEARQKLEKNNWSVLRVLSK